MLEKVRVLVSLVINLLVGLGIGALLIPIILAIAVAFDDPTVLQPIAIAIGVIGVSTAAALHGRENKRVRVIHWAVSFIAVLLPGIIVAADKTSDALRYPEFAYSIGQETAVAPECGCRYRATRVYPMDWPVNQGVLRITPEVMGGYKVDGDTVFILYTRVDRPLPPAMYIADTKESLQLRGHYPDRLSRGWLGLWLTQEATAWLFDWPDDLPIKTEVLIQREKPIISP